jgi:tetratricopeptide (TPR) repeat protein
MMDNLDYIARFFNHELDNDQAVEFGKKIESDPSFAEDVAFYLSVLKASEEKSQEEKKQHFKKLYADNRAVRKMPAVKWLYYIAAAAAVAGIVFGTYTFIRPVSPSQLADQYVHEHLQTLGVTMNGRADSLQKGIQLYNEGKSSEALTHFEKIILSDTSNFTAKQYAGLAALRLKEYDRALAWFDALGTYNGLYANPARLYQSITLMERNQSGDAAKAKQLLQEIVESDSEGKETAQEWLRKW